MGSVNIKINMMGADAMLRLLTRTPVAAIPYVSTALNEEAQMIMAESQAYLVPVDNGDLARSAAILPPEVDNANISITMGYGGAASAYAMYIHELTESPSGKPINWSKAGSGAKYLETPTRRAIPFIERRIFQTLNALIRESR